MDEKTHITDYPDVLTPSDVQKILRTGRNTVYKMLKDGSINSLRIGNAYRIPKQIIVEFIMNQV